MPIIYKLNVNPALAIAEQDATQESLGSTDPAMFECSTEIVADGLHENLTLRNVFGSCLTPDTSTVRLVDGDTQVPFNITKAWSDTDREFIMVLPDSVLNKTLTLTYKVSGTGMSTADEIGRTKTVYADSDNSEEISALFTFDAVTETPPAYAPTLGKTVTSENTIDGEIYTYTVNFDATDITSIKNYSHGFSTYNTNNTSIQGMLINKYQTIRPDEFTLSYYDTNGEAHEVDIAEYFNAPAIDNTHSICTLSVSDANKLAEHQYYKLQYKTILNLDEWYQLSLWQTDNNIYDHTLIYSGDNITNNLKLEVTPNPILPDWTLTCETPCDLATSTTGSTDIWFKLTVLIPKNKSYVGMKFFQAVQSERPIDYMTVWADFDSGSSAHGSHGDSVTSCNTWTPTADYIDLFDNNIEYINQSTYAQQIAAIFPIYEGMLGHSFSVYYCVQPSTNSQYYYGSEVRLQSRAGFVPSIYSTNTYQEQYLDQLLKNTQKHYAGKYYNMPWIDQYITPAVVYPFNLETKDLDPHYYYQNENTEISCTNDTLITSDYYLRDIYEGDPQSNAYYDMCYENIDTNNNLVNYFVPYTIQLNPLPQNNIFNDNDKLTFECTIPDGYEVNVWNHLYIGGPITPYRTYPGDTPSYFSPVKKSYGSGGFRSYVANSMHSYYHAPIWGMGLSTYQYLTTYSLQSIIANISSATPNQNSPTLFYNENDNKYIIVCSAKLLKKYGMCIPISLVPKYDNFLQSHESNDKIKLDIKLSYINRDPVLHRAVYCFNKMFTFNTTKLQAIASDGDTITWRLTNLIPTASATSNLYYATVDGATEYIKISLSNEYELLPDSITSDKMDKLEYLGFFDANDTSIPTISFWGTRSSLQAPETAVQTAGYWFRMQYASYIEFKTKVPYDLRNTAMHITAERYKGPFNYQAGPGIKDGDKLFSTTSNTKINNTVFDSRRAATVAAVGSVASGLPDKKLLTSPTSSDPSFTWELTMPPMGDVYAEQLITDNTPIAYKDEITDGSNFKTEGGQLYHQVLRGDDDTAEDVTAAFDALTQINYTEGATYFTITVQPSDIAAYMELLKSGTIRFITKSYLDDFDSITPDTKVQNTVMIVPPDGVTEDTIKSTAEWKPANIKIDKAYLNLENNLITWQIKVVPNENMVQDSIVINDGIYPERGNASDAKLVLDTLKAYTSEIPGEGLDPVITQIPCSGQDNDDGTFVFTLTEPANVPMYIEYQTKLTGSLLLSPQTIRNKAHGFGPEDTDSKNVTAITFTTTKSVAELFYDHITWKVDVTPSIFCMDNMELVINDIPDNGLELIEDSVRFMDGDAVIANVRYETTKNDTGFIIKTTHAGEDLIDVSSSTISVLYDTTRPTDTDGEYSNKAKVSLQDETGTYKLTKDTNKTQAQYQKLLDKQSAYNPKRSRMVTFTVSVNPQSFDLVKNADTITLHDVLGDNLIYQPGSAKGSKIVGEEAVDVEVTTVYDSETKTLDFTVPDGESFNLTYDCILVTSSQVKDIIKETGEYDIRNSIAWEINEEEETQESISSLKTRELYTSNMLASFIKGGQIIIYKTDADDSDKLLKATFAVETYDLIDKGDFHEASGTVKDTDTVTTGESGVTISKASRDVLYKIYETKAPEGYQLDSSPKYLIITTTPDQYGIIKDSKGQEIDVTVCDIDTASNVGAILYFADKVIPPKEEPPKENPPKDEPTKDEPQKDEPTKDEPQKDEPTKDEPQKEPDKPSDAPSKTKPETPKDNPKEEKVTPPSDTPVTPDNPKTSTDTKEPDAHPKDDTPVSPKEEPKTKEPVKIPVSPTTPVQKAPQIPFVPIGFIKDIFFPKVIESNDNKDNTSTTISSSSPVTEQVSKTSSINTAQAEPDTNDIVIEQARASQTGDEAMAMWIRIVLILSAGIIIGIIIVATLVNAKKKKRKIFAYR